MTDTAIFAFARAADDVVNIRTATIDGEPWFVAADVCRALGLSTTNGVSNHLLKLTAEERQTRRAGEFAHEAASGSKGGLRPNTKLTAISESGVYKLTMRSDKDEAVAFQHWIATEVLPSIRKTGKYALADHGREAMPLPMDIAEALA